MPASIAVVSQTVQHAASRIESAVASFTELDTSLGSAAAGDPT